MEKSPQCKMHSCLIPLPHLRCFRTSSPDAEEVFCISKPEKNEKQENGVQNWLDWLYI